MTAHRADTSEIKRANRSRVFRYLYHHPHITKQELAAGCDLSMPTITANLAELQGMGLLETSGVKDSTGGRRARLLAVSPTARFAIGVNITAHHVSCVLLDLYGRMVCHSRERLPFANTRSYMRQLSEMIWQMPHEQRIRREYILGVGLSVPAILSGDGETLSYASLLNFTDGKLRDFEEPIGMNCRFMNDASAGGYAELWHDPVMLTPDRNEPMAYLSLNNSVGGAFFVDGREYTGMNRRASEFGHTTLYPDGKPCYCGRIGCADPYLRALRLSERTGGDLRRFFELLDANDPQACALWSRYRIDLARCVNSIRMAFDCYVVLGGYVGEYLAPYLPELRKMAAALNTFENDGSYLRATTTELENSAVGAALQWIMEYAMGI